MKKRNLLLAASLMLGASITLAQTTTNYGANSGTQSTYSSYFEYQASHINTANYNTFLGYESGVFNTTGVFDTFLEVQAGSENTLGKRNSFFV